MTLRRRRALLCTALLAVSCGGEPETTASVERDAPAARDRNRRVNDASAPESLEAAALTLLDESSYEPQGRRARSMLLQGGEASIELLAGWLVRGPGEDERAILAEELLPEFGLAAINALLPLLQHTDAAVRESVITILLAIRGWERSEQASRVVEALLPILDDPDGDLRWEVIGALARGKEHLAPHVDRLVAHLPSLGHRQAVILAEALAGFGSRSAGAIDALVQLVRSSHPRGGWAGDALARCRPTSAEQIAAVVAMAIDDRFVRPEVIEILEAWGDAAAAAAPSLIEALRDPDPEMRMAAAAALGNMPSASETTVLPLFELFSDDDADVRSSAHDAIEGLGPAVRRLIPSLLAQVQASWPERRLVVLRGLVWIDWGHGPDVPAGEKLPERVFREWLADPDPDVRRAAVRLIGVCAFRDPEADERVLLRPLLDDSDASVRRAAADAYDRCEDDPDALAAVLRPRLTDASAHVRIEAAASLGDVDTLVTVLAAEEPRWVHERALSALRSIGIDAKDAGPAVVAWLERHPGSQQGKLALKTLADIDADDERTVDLLGRMLGDEALVRDALWALNFLDRKSAPVAHLVAPHLGTASGSVAAGVFAGMGDAAAGDDLVAAIVLVLEDDETIDVRHAFHALRSIGPAAAAAEPAVREHLSGPHKEDVLETIAAITTDPAAFAEELLAWVRREPDDLYWVDLAMQRLGPEGAFGLVVTSSYPEDGIEYRLPRNEELLQGLGDAGREAVSRALSNERLRPTAVRLLGVLPPAAWPDRLHDALRDDDPNVRAAAARAVDHLVPRGLDPAPYGPRLVRILEEGGAGGAAAARVLGTLRPTPAGAVSALERALAGETEASADAAGALFRITKKPQPSLRALAEVLRVHGTWDAQCWDRVGVYIAEMGPLADPIAEELNSAVLRSHGQRDLVRAIGALGPDAGATCLPALRSALAGEAGTGWHYDTDTVLAAVEAARRLGPAVRPALPELRALLSEDMMTTVTSRGEDEETFTAAVRAAIRSVEGR